MEKIATQRLYVILLALIPILACEPDVEFSGRSLDKKQVIVLEDKEFSAALIGDMESTYKPQFGIISDQMTLKEKPLLKSRLQQIVRSDMEEVFLQGHDGDFITQEFDISAAGKLDLLFVIDNSGSMGEEQAELSENLKALTLHMDNVDWQIGVITTDACNLQNASNPDQPIKRTDSNAFVNFEQTVKGLGTSGDRDERGIKMAMLHFMGKCPVGSNKWLRNDAVLGVFFVSDEQNECDLDCKDEKGVPWGPNELINLMKSMRKSSDLKAYGLLWNRDSSGVESHNPQCRRDSGVEAYGTRYSQVVQAFGGIERSICLDNSPMTNDYIPLLEVVSKDVSRVVRNEFSIKADPIQGSLKLAIDGVPVGDAVVTGRKIVLKSARGDQAKLQASYRTGAVSRFNRLSTSETVAQGTLKVLVNDAVDSNYVQEGKQINFTAPPPDRAQVKVLYKKDTPLLKDFYVGTVPVENSVKKVWVQGKELTNWQYSADKKIIKLDKAPQDGETVEFEYLEKSPKIVSYKLPTNRMNPKRMHVFDVETGIDLQSRVENGNISFLENDVLEGRKVVLEYVYGDESDVLAEELAYEPIDNTLSVTSTGGEQSCIDGVNLSGKILSFTCNGKDLGDVVVKYQYVLERYNEFKLDKNVPTDATLQVYVDKSAIKEFVFRDGVVIVPDRYLDIDSKVRIIVTVEGSVPNTNE